MPSRSQAAARGWQVGGAGRPVLGVDYNESDDEGLMMALSQPWQIEVGDRVYCSDVDGIGCWAVVRSRFDSEYVVVEATPYPPLFTVGAAA